MNPLTISLALCSLPLLMACTAISAARESGRPAQSGRRAVQPRVEYIVRAHEAHAQVVHMTIIVRGVRSPSLDLMLPVWRPGRYQVLDQAGSIRTLEARSGAGDPLKVEKTDKSTWRVTTQGTDEVVADYVLYANSLADRTRHADSTHVFLSPAAAFLYVPELRAEPLRVTIDCPEEWTVATGLEPETPDADESAPKVLLAPDYDTLVDSPIEAGFLDTLRFDVEGVPHEIAFWTGHRPPVLTPLLKREKFNPEQLKKDFAAIVASQKSLFGDMPYKRYVFIVHCYAGGGGGTEHVNSTVMQASPTRFDTAESYRGFLGLASHEMFHTWNVKQLRPADLKPYDYQREQYSRLLWVVEGTTSYYDDLTLVRTGHMKPDDYLKNLGDAIDAARRRPGSGVQSLEDSSFDSWIKYNRPSPDSVNSTVSFYDKGAQASLVLDMGIRRASAGKSSLDDAMRALYRGFPLNGPGYTSTDVLAAVNTAAGADLSDAFARAVRTTEALDFERALEVVGLEVTHKPAKKDDDKAAASEAGDAPKERSYLGFTVTDQSGLASVSAVLADGPAYSAGLLAGDHIVAINGERFRASDLEALLKRLKPGDAVRVSFFRYDALRELELKAAAVPDAKWTVSRAKSPTDEQRAAYESWLGQKWPADKNADKPADASKDGP